MNPPTPRPVGQSVADILNTLANPSPARLIALANEYATRADEHDAQANRAHHPEDAAHLRAKAAEKRAEAAQYRERAVSLILTPITNNTPKAA